MTRMASTQILIDAALAIDTAFTKQGNFDREHTMCEDDIDVAVAAALVFGYAVPAIAITEAKAHMEIHQEYLRLLREEQLNG